MTQNELRDGINRILFHIQSNELRADKIAELIAPELEKARILNDKIGHLVGTDIAVLVDKARMWDRVKALGNRTDSDECDKDCPYFTTEIVDGCEIFGGCPFVQVVDALDGEVKE